MKFKIQITETLQKVVEVEAENLSDAITKTKLAYYNGLIELNENDYITTEMEEYKDA